MIEMMIEMIEKVQRLCKTPGPVDVVANPRHLAALRMTLSPATGKIGLISSVAGALPIYESVAMPDNAMVVSMSDGPMAVIAIGGGEITEEDKALALRAAAKVKAELREHYTVADDRVGVGAYGRRESDRADEVHGCHESATGRGEAERDAVGEAQG